MSVVIVGGNECMERRYKDLCEKYGYKAKVFTKMTRNMKSIGNPDLLILFTNTMSHKMLHSVINETKRYGVCVERCHTSSATALKNILDNHMENCCVARFKNK